MSCTGRHDRNEEGRELDERADRYPGHNSPDRIAEVRFGVRGHPQGLPSEPGVRKWLATDEQERWRNINIADICSDGIWRTHDLEYH